MFLVIDENIRLCLCMMTEIQTKEGGWKDVSSLEGTTLKKLKKKLANATQNMTSSKKFFFNFFFWF